MSNSYIFRSLLLWEISFGGCQLIPYNQAQLLNTPLFEILIANTIINGYIVELCDTLYGRL